MLQKDLVREIKNSMNSVKGQLDGIVKMLGKDHQDPEKILIQFKAARKALESAEFLLLDETFRKSLAVKLSETMEACNGECGQEDAIEMLRKQFPNLGLDELTKKMKEVQAVYEQMKKNQEKK
jgi:DNA-binding FrmR family transcriptional regulator